MTALTANNIIMVPIRSGVGLRLGANLGYLKFTERPTWNPFWAFSGRIGRRLGNVASNVGAADKVGLG